MALTKISRSLLDTGVSDSSDATAITISSSEQVMIGTTDAGYPDYGDSLTVADVDGGGGNAGMTIRSGTSSYGTFYFSDATGTAAGTYAGKIQYNHSNNSMIFGTNSADRLIIDSSGNLLFNSGFGSAGTAYAVRAWVNFDGSGTVSIRESGNVSSITDHGVGQYTCNFSSAMPDGDYVICGSAGHTAEANQISVTQNRGATAPATSSCRISVTYANSYLIDVGQVTAAFIR